MHLHVYGKQKSPKSDKLGFSEKKTMLIRQKNQLSKKKTKISSRKPSFSEQLGFSNSGDFCVRKIGCSKVHSVLPINGNGFRFSEVSYHEF